ncbi:MAG: TetR/AcrR family transcriptional regulator [Bacteroidota bacterium]|nr:TetR/AcrR family transcriptional regulator [Bacteroidota bacterium]
MELSLKIKMNEKLFLRNPEETELGRKIIENSIVLIHKLGFEAFTFKKLAEEITTTEAGIYRYFENKHRLLIYIVEWYWSWQEYRLIFQINNIKNPETKLKKAIRLVSTPIEDDISTTHINENLLYEIVMSEGAKSFLTKHVAEDNKAKLFKPYKDFCACIARIILECNPKYKYPHSLSSTIVEMAHSQNFYVKHLPSLTDFGNPKEEPKIASFLEDLVFSSIKV